jgi:hypothetical protein
MIRKHTGVIFTPKEFRELNYCVGCSKMLEIQFGGKCPECLEKNLQPCEMCEIMLESGKHKHYSYDIREDKRDGERVQYVSKKLVREFLEIEEKDNKYSDTLCKFCQGWESRIKDICFLCDNDFVNSREHYKLNGNMCPECSTQFQKKWVK